MHAWIYLSEYFSGITFSGGGSSSSILTFAEVIYLKHFLLLLGMMPGLPGLDWRRCGWGNKQTHGGAGRQKQVDYFIFGAVGIGAAAPRDADGL